MEILTEITKIKNKFQQSKYIEIISFETKYNYNNNIENYPDEIKKLFKNFTSLDFFWSSKYCVNEDKLNRVSSGTIELGESLLDSYNMWKLSIDNNYKMPVDLFNSYPLQEVINGDMLIYTEKGEVYCLDHEQPHKSRRVGKDLNSFYETWIKLYCPGPESWILDVFYDRKERAISSENKNAKIWLQFIDELIADTI